MIESCIIVNTMTTDHINKEFDENIKQFRAIIKSPREYYRTEYTTWLPRCTK